MREPILKTKYAASLIYSNGETFLRESNNKSHLCRDIIAELRDDGYLPEGSSYENTRDGMEEAAADAGVEVEWHGKSNIVGG